MKIHLVQSMDEVLKFALAGDVDALAKQTPVQPSVPGVEVPAAVPGGLPVEDNRAN
jgi:hypothetical protein